MIGNTEPAKLEARIDLTRQVIGKAIEEGVLRKEDEAKYAKILPTLRDKPEVALDKIDMVASKLDQDLATYIETQKASGRRIPDLPKDHKDPLGIR